MEPVSLSITQVREEIRRAMGDQAAGPGEPSSALLGRIFHDVFAELLGNDPARQWQGALEPETLSNRRKLLEHIYGKLLGPRLTANHAVLQERGPEVLNLWKATQEMADWVGSLLEASFRDRILDYDRGAQSWLRNEKLCVPEQTLTWTFRERDWIRPVQVTGTPDAIWRNPKTGKWCVVEYKLGRTAPEADATQACLYHLILAASGWLPPDPAGAIAVISFLPELQEKFFDAGKLAGIQRELKALIGRLAGVLPGQAKEESGFLLPEAPQKEEHQVLGKKLVQALEQYGAVVELRGNPIAGPAFLRYTIMPGKGIKVASILSRAEDLQIRLGLDHAPMIQKAGGKLVIDVQRPDRQTVLFSGIKAQLPSPDDARSRSKVILGVDLFGTLQFTDLAKTPHLLVAGTSGSGKTEWLRTALAGLICSNTPETLRLVLIDPKRNAFGELKESPYLLDGTALVYPPEVPASDVLDRLIEEMEERYRLFEKRRASDLLEYCEHGGGPLPRIVCVCDEYADMVARRGDKREVEERIRRLGAKARAAGIHLILATQYPRADIVDVALKANLPGRVCLRTTTYVQSNLVIGSSGAERLLGQGDLFWVDIGDPVRLQAPLLTAEDRARILGWRAPALLEAAR